MALEDEFDTQAERLRKQRADNSKYESWIKWLAKQEGKDEEAFIKALLLTTARRVVERKREAWLQTAAEKARMMNDCAKSHTSPPAGYWEAEHKALGVYQEAERYLAIIEAEA